MELKRKNLKENKCLSDAQENINKSLMELMQIIKYMRIEFNPEAETLKGTKDELRIELKNPKLNERTQKKC